LCIHNELNFKIPVHIADGSISDSNKKIISDFQSKNKNLDIDYKYYGKDTDLDQFYRKTCLALQKIKTDYVILACNDDFLIEDSIREGASFLNQNKDYVAAVGPVYDTTIGQTNPSHNQVWGILSHPINQYPAFERSEDDPTQRIYHFLAGRNNSYIYSALHRRTVLLQTCEIIVDISPPDLRFHLHLISLLSLCFGKVSKEMQCMTIHQDNPGESAGQDLMQKGSWYQWIQSKEWYACYNKMIKALTDQITINNTAEKRDITRLIEFYYQALVGQSIMCQFHPTYKNELFCNGETISRHSSIYDFYLTINKICNRDSISKSSNFSTIIHFFKNGFKSD
jgi:glycosyltransferase domain-containing protein